MIYIALTDPFRPERLGFTARQAQRHWRLLDAPDLPAERHARWPGAMLQRRREHLGQVGKSGARAGRKKVTNEKDDGMSNDKGKLYADMDPTIKDMLPDSEVFENEEQALDYLKRYRKLLAPSSRAFDEGGTVSELLARFAEYAARDPEVAREAGKERGRAWASDQESWDPRWVSLALHSGREVCVEVNTWDLAFSNRDREYGAYADEYANAFIEAAQAYFREHGS